MLVIYQESLHDVRSTKYKMLQISFINMRIVQYEQNTYSKE